MKKVLLSSVTALSLFWLSTPAVLIVRADESGEVYSAYVDDGYNNNQEMTPDQLRDVVDKIKEQNGANTELDKQYSEAITTTPSGQPAVVDTPSGDKTLVYGEKTDGTQTSSSDPTPTPTPPSSEPASSTPPASSASTASSSAPTTSSNSSASKSDTPSSRAKNQSPGQSQKQGRNQRSNSKSRAQAGKSAVTGPARAASKAITRALKAVAADLKKAEDPAEEGADEQSLPKTSAVK